MHAKELGGMVQRAMKKGVGRTKTATQEVTTKTRTALKHGRDAVKPAVHDAGKALDQATR